MSSEYQSSNVRAPTQTGTDNSGVTTYAVSTTHGTSALPAGWDGTYLECSAEGCNVFVLFGKTSSLEVSAAATGAGVTTGARIADGSSKHWRVPSGYSYISVETDSGSGVLRVQLAAEETK